MQFLLQLAYLSILAFPLVCGIEFVDYFGTVILRAGDVQDFACEAAGDDEAEFFWTLGNRRLENSHDLGDSIASSRFLHIRILPTIEDSDSELKCWEGENYDVIKLSVYDLSILDMSEIDDNMSGELSVDAVVFPPPKRTDFTWKIDGFGQNVLDLHPGTGSVDRDLVALPVEEISDNTYRLTLDISQLQPELLSSLNFSLYIQSDVGGLVAAVFQRAPLISPKGSLPEAAALQVPFWIWICVAVMVVVFSAIFAIIYLAMVRRKAPKPVRPTETKVEGNNVYIRVNSRDTSRQ